MTTRANGRVLRDTDFEGLEVRRARARASRISKTPPAAHDQAIRDIHGRDSAVAAFRVWADRTSSKCEHSVRQAAYLARIGRLFLDAPDEVLESFVLNRRDKTGTNIHAIALARKRNANLPRERLSEWGKTEAAALWQKRRAATVFAESIAIPPESSATEGQAVNEPM